MSAKNKTARWSYSKHQWLGLIGGISLLVWGLSGLTHIAMVLFGPQQEQFMPPAANVALEDLRSNEDAVDAHLLADCMQSDPLMTLKLLAHIAQLRRGRDTGDPETVTEALVLLGISPFFRAGHSAWVRGEPTPFLPGPPIHRLTLQPQGPVGFG